MPSISDYKERDAYPAEVVSPGRYSFEELYLIANGVQHELVDKVVVASIFESLYQPFLSAELTVLDSKSLLHNAGVVGGEKVVIKVKDHHQIVREFEFYVVKVSNYRMHSLGSATYTLHLTSKHVIRSTMSKVSQAYTAHKPDQIISDLLSKIGFDASKFYWADSDFQFACVIPYWRPIYAAKWVAAKAKSSAYAGSPWRLFQDIRGDIYHLPLDLLYREQSIRILRWVPQDAKQTQTKFDPNFAKARYYFTNFEIVMNSDLLTNLEEGLFKARVDNIDLANRISTEEEYEYGVEFAASEHLGTIPIKFDSGFSLEPSDIPHSIQIPRQDGLFSQSIPGSEQFEGAAQIISKNQQTRHLIVRGELNGSHEYRVAQKYTIEVPRFDSEDTDRGIAAPDTRISGQFLVESIRHVFSQNGEYKVAMTMFKDAFG